MKVIVSLTTYSNRMVDDKFIKCLDSLVNQKFSIPFHICLTLFIDDVKNINERLADYIKEHHIELLVSTKNYKPHLKYLLAMRKYPDALVFTGDDDIAYDENTLETLYNSYLKFPTCVQCGRVHKLEFNDDGSLKPYKKWDRDFHNVVDQPLDDLFITGVGGVLYPPNFLTNVSNDKFEQMFNDLSKQDDFLLTQVAYLNKNNIVLVSNPLRSYLHNSGYFGKPIDTDQTSNFNLNALYHFNVNQNQNDVYITKVDFSMGFKNKNDNKKVIPSVCYISDVGYIELTKKSIDSLLKSKTSARIYVVISYDIDEEKNKLYNEFSSLGDSVSIIDGSQFADLLESIKKNSRIPHVSKAAILKMMLPELLKDEDQVLYIDGDTLINKSLNSLLAINLGNRLVGAVKDAKLIDPKAGYLMKNTAGFLYKEIILGNGGYFNSGVMLLNLKQMRIEQTSSSLLRFGSTHKTRFVDQDTFNIIFEGRVKWLDGSYNFIPYSIKKDTDIITCHIFHSAGPNKDAVYKKWVDLKQQILTNSSNLKLTPTNQNDKIVGQEAKLDKHDIVYILGSGSNFNNKEIKISLLSMIRNCGGWIDKIYIIGKDPKISNPLVSVIHYHDIYSTKDANIINKIKTAIDKIPDLSEDFLVCFDDQVVTHPMEFSDFKPLAVKLFDPNNIYFKAFKTSKNIWNRNVFDTMMRFWDKDKSPEENQIYFYHPHSICSFNKTKFLEMFSSISINNLIKSNDIILYSLYFNKFKPEVVEIIKDENILDCVFKPTEYIKYVLTKNKTLPDIICYDDRAFKTSAFQTFLLKAIGE